MGASNQAGWASLPVSPQLLQALDKLLTFSELETPAL